MTSPSALSPTPRTTLVERHNTPVAPDNANGAKRLSDLQLAGSCELPVQAREAPVSRPRPTTPQPLAELLASRMPLLEGLDKKVGNARIREGSRRVAQQDSCLKPEIPRPVAEVLTLSITLPWSDLHTYPEHHSLRKLRRNVTEHRRSTAIFPDPRLPKSSAKSTLVCRTVQLCCRFGYATIEEP